MLSIPGIASRRPFSRDRIVPLTIHTRSGNSCASVTAEEPKPKQESLFSWALLSRSLEVSLV